ncbi:MAG: sporulation protein YqfD [Chitinophagales bacterium]
MHVRRLWSFLAGYVIIRVKGPALERFVNLAASRGIGLHNIVRLGPDALLAETSVAGFKALRPLARRLGCAMHIRRRGGVPFFLSALGHRKALAAGVALFLLALYGLSSFVWFIQVVGVGAARSAEIQAYLRGEGLRAGVRAASLDRDRLARSLLRRYPDLTWADVTVRGTLVRVEVVPKTLVRPEDSAPRHVVAARDGLITACVPLKGEPVVKPGDTVARGQVLISGVVVSEPGPILPAGTTGVQPVRPWHFDYVRAEGSVRARVWYEGVGRVPLSGTVDLPTGRRRVVTGWQVGRWRIWFGPRSAPFVRYRTSEESLPLSFRAAGGLRVPVEVLKITFVELNQVQYHRGAALAERLARQEAVARVRRQSARGKLLKATSEVERTPGAVKVRIVWEVEEEIQAFQAIKVGDPPPPGLPLPQAQQGSERRE